MIQHRLACHQTPLSAALFPQGADSRAVCRCACAPDPMRAALPDVSGGAVHVGTFRAGVGGSARSFRFQDSAVFCAMRAVRRGVTAIRVCHHEGLLSGRSFFCCGFP
jgi:hypothetical protein